MAAALAATTLIYYILHGDLISGGATLPGLVLMLVILPLLRRQRFRLAFEVFLWGLLLIALIAGFTVAGFQTPGMLLLPMVTTFASWLLGARRMWLMLGIIAVAIIILAWQQTIGNTPSAVREPSFWAVLYLSVCTMGAVFGAKMAASVRDGYRRTLDLANDLAELNRALEYKVQMRTSELEQTLDNLRRTQDDLIESEKLASLGSTVAGIAHELNTPLGIAVTVLSTMKERADSLRAAVEGGQIKRSHLLSETAALREGVELCERSVIRAATLVSSFKQVAMDQVSEKRRPFDVRQVIEDNINSLRPGLKNAPWLIANNVPEGIVCDSYPGPLGQVLVNLIQNAIIHGFDQRQHGRIDIDAIVDAGIMTLRVSDDGIGMDTATAARVFDPFFTTKLGKGGSGLGLAVSYRIATTVLAGELRVQSSVGTGTQFWLRMPLRTPGKI